MSNVPPSFRSLTHARAAIGAPPLARQLACRHTHFAAAPWHAPRPCTLLLRPLSASDMPRLILSLRSALSGSTQAAHRPGMTRNSCPPMAVHRPSWHAHRAVREPMPGPSAHRRGQQRASCARSTQPRHQHDSAAQRSSIDAGRESLCEARPQRQAAHRSACNAGARTVQPRQVRIWAPSCIEGRLWLG